MVPETPVAVESQRATPGTLRYVLWGTAATLGLSGAAAALSGIDVAGKTGTAEVGGSNQAWFIAFAPVQSPRVAIAVTVERTSGQGGTIAAPIAKRVMETLLR
jgi:peptidoglycan glycosyltransferase